MPTSRFKNIKKIKGGYSASALRVTLVVSEFNEVLTNQLLEGALDTLLRHGAREKNIRIVYVPGAFEIPLAVQKTVLKNKTDVVITLAVVIRGQTKHFDQVAAESAKGVREVALRTKIPVILGIIPAENVQDAMNRVGLKQMNKGREWALAAIEMANVLRKI